MEQGTALVKQERLAGRKAQLTAQQHEAIAMILEGMTSQEIANNLGVHYETVCRWRRQKVFARWLAREAQRVSETSLAILQANVTHATQRLVEMIDDKEAKPTQYNAAMSVIKIVYEHQMLTDLALQVRELEQAANREP